LTLTSEQLHELPSPFYRVAVKAVIFDDQQRMLMVINSKGNAELPGGGWEHDEDLEVCLQREAQEEIGVALKNISPVWFTFRGHSLYSWHVLRLVVKAELASTDFKLGDDMSKIQYVTKGELLALPNVAPGDVTIKQYVDMIWSKN
jgi:ADP-ribose pyrophosphatase YjhB (NUDIX family)